MNSNNNNENHETAHCPFFSPFPINLFVTIALLHQWENHRHGGKVVIVSLRYKQEMDYIENIEAQSNLK